MKWIARISLLFLFAGTASAWTGPSTSAPNGNVSAPVNVGSADQVKSATLGVNGLAVFGNSLLQASSYLNWGATSGSTGYGIRDSAGTLQFKNSGGTWESLQTIVFNLTGGASSWATSGTNIYNSNSGNVGIGTSGPTQKLDVAGNITASIYYDRDNTGYYLNPNGTSITNDLRASIVYDVDNTGYYLNPNGTSRLNYPYVDNLYSYSTTYIPFIYDTNNTAYYLDPSSVSIVNDMRASIYYDRDSTTYYLNPNGSSYIYDAYVASRGLYLSYMANKYGGQYYTYGSCSSGSLMAGIYYLNIESGQYMILCQWI